ncbi:SDR family oxidoreductase [Sphingomonas sp. PAMC 26621]|uniref:SDR family oxidoreductase n=1 Tax=Sphingomonas sp. PAMC 26621 TaxID=1112213 RepID=UPI00028852A9|nr:SDR family oxidoreductase [Sphingomonas sp. PAMC 26621]
MFSNFDAISVGDVRTLSKHIGEEDVQRFVDMTGDNNPLHVDRDYAETTPFKDIVVHGMLGASFISTVIGTKLPGPGALWVSQNMEFRKPVRLGDDLVIACTVLKKHDRDRLLELETTITNQNDEIILSGHAKVKVLATKVQASPVAPVAAKVAIVTGGAGGIGGAISRRLSADGYAVVVTYARSRDRADRLVAELQAAGGKALAVQGDASRAGVGEAVVKACVNAFGGVSVLVNNASPAIGPKPLTAVEWSDVQKHLDVQLRGAFEISTACFAHMSAAGFGRIVNITSQVVESNPTPGWTAYSVAKSALAALSRQMAAEYGPLGVTVNSIAPGMTETALIGDISEKMQLMIARQTPLRRLSTPEDVAAAVAFLASDEAAYINGHSLSVNGGSSM